MSRSERDGSNVLPLPHARAYQKVEYPSLRHLMDDLALEQVRGVRLDVFEEARASELSFVFYVTLTLYVTALDASGYTLYEYKENIATAASTDPVLDHDEPRLRAQRRMEEVFRDLSAAGFDVRGGRYALPRT
ncbi:MAG: hypothetical protein IRZ33_00960 [Alicyclobacillaceae bacterium]|nr:hypothetical protein [Alicyclobacillaceae bacterium]